jgi:signal transduction histidine kinase
VKADAGDLLIAFEDDGVGFQPPSDPSVPPRQRGLINLKTRAAAIGGEISWSSSSAGTRVLLRRPISPSGPSARN